MGMGNRNGSGGHLLSAAGGGGLALSLWMPWYTIHFPQAALNSVDQMSQQFGALGQLMRSGARLINQLGPFHVTAWQAFKTAPAVLLVVAIIGGGLAVLALTERAGNISQLTMLGGVLAALLVGYRIAVPPGQNGIVHPDWGIYLALVSALTMLAGGALSRNPDSEPGYELPTPWQPADSPAVGGSTAGLAQSVAPPAP